MRLLTALSLLLLASAGSAAKPFRELARTDCTEYETAQFTKGVLYAYSYKVGRLFLCDLTASRLSLCPTLLQRRTVVAAATAAAAAAASLRDNNPAAAAGTKAGGGVVVC